MGRNLEIQMNMDFSLSSHSSEGTRVHTHLRRPFKELLPGRSAWLLQRRFCRCRGRDSARSRTLFSSAPPFSPASLVALLMMANRSGLAHAACSQGQREDTDQRFSLCLLRAA